MNRQQRKEAKKLRRRRRLAAETPGKRLARDLRRHEAVEKGVSVMFDEVLAGAPVVPKVSPEKPRQVPVHHGDRGMVWVEVDRVIPGGDLYGKVVLEADVAEAVHKYRESRESKAA